jgi:hypothetical protein
VDLPVHFRRRKRRLEGLQQLPLVLVADQALEDQEGRYGADAVTDGQVWLVEDVDLPHDRTG